MQQNQLQINALILHVLADSLRHFVGALFVELHVHAKGETTFEDRVLGQHIQARMAGKVNPARGKDQVHRRKGKRIHGALHGFGKRLRLESADIKMHR
jgi:hypothetical protein